MAKQTKSGLGRGLSTLMGGSFGESAPKEPQPEPKAPKPEVKEAKPERQHITIEPGEIPAYDPILEPSSMRARPHAPKNVAPKPEQSPVKAEPSAEAAPTPAETKPRTVVNVAPEEPREAPPKQPAAVEEAAGERNQDYRPAVDGESTMTIAIEKIEPNPNQPRTSFDKTELEELAASIDREGLLQPILVRKTEKGKYQIVAGERRWQASKMAGLKEVPIILKDVSEDKAIELALIENLQRSDLNPIEEAYGYRRLMDRKRWTQAQLAVAMSKGRSTIANALRLLDLPEDAQQLLFEEKITAGHARAILSISSSEGRERLTEKLKNEKLSVREAENIARLMSYREKDTKTAQRPAIPESYKRVAKALRDVLNTTVRVRTSKGKNRIEIDFADEAELDRIFEGIIPAKDEA